MNWALWWVFVPADAALCLVPGPAVLLVLSTALRLGWRRSLASNAGILCANAAFFGLSATGLGVVISKSYGLVSWVRWFGAAYLIWLGVREILSKGNTREALALGGESGPSQLFRQALMTQLSNPKALVFFGAFLPQFVDSRFPVGQQILILAATELVTEFLILYGYGVFGSAAGNLVREPRYVVWTSRVAGTLLIVAALVLGFLR
jgi:threonine/homoserine/homoserine lactone efflux protein